jgi:hypothetical protein
MEGRGRSFAKGRSGNPAGRPKGARNRTTLAAEALLEGKAEAITQKVVDMALDGDLTAARMCLDRILPIRRERRVSFELPPLDSAEDIVKGMKAIAAALASGELSPREAAEIGNFVGWHAKSIEVLELEQRIKLLETRPKFSWANVDDLKVNQHEKGNGASLGGDGATEIREP